METQTQTRVRPNLAPVRVDRPDEDDYPRGPPSSHHLPLFSASLGSPSGLASPMYLNTPRYDAGHGHQQEMLEKLNRNRSKRAELQSPRRRPRMLSPMVGSPGAGRREPVSALSPRHIPAQSPPSRILHHPRRPTLAAETRNILLSGVAESQAEVLSAATPVSPATRRQSMPSFPTSRQIGQLYLKNPFEPECFVLATSLDQKRKEAPPREGKSDASDKDAEENVEILRVPVFRRDGSGFWLKGKFNMDKLRSMGPEPSTVPPSMRRLSADLHPRAGSRQSRSRSPGSATGDHGADGAESAVKTATPNRPRDVMPIRKQLLILLTIAWVLTIIADYKYARIYFPMIAEIIDSKQIPTKVGNVIHLPIPHPEAWKDTVTHVYTGDGELTEAIKQNIIYLGGKV